MIVALLRHADPRPEVDPLTAAVLRSEQAAGPSAAELAALEHALRIAESTSDTVLAVVAGPPGAERTLREAAAVGARPLRVPVEDPVADERGLAGALADAIRSVGEPWLVLCGDRSGDRGTGALPAFLAHELDAAQALGLVSLTVDGDRLVGERRLPKGRRERLAIPRPAVCSVEAAGVRLRRAGLRAELAARKASAPVADVSAPESPIRVGAARPYVPRTHAAPPPPEGSSRERMLSLTGALEQRDPPTVVRADDAASAVDTLLEFLRHHGYEVP